MAVVLYEKYIESVQINEYNIYRKVISDVRGEYYGTDDDQRDGAGMEYISPQGCTVMQSGQSRGRYKKGEDMAYSL